MDDRLSDIVEVVNCGRRKANLYLEVGYRLLGSGVISHEEQGTHQIYIRRQWEYVLGRPAGVEHFEPPEREPAPPLAEPAAKG